MFLSLAPFMLLEAPKPDRFAGKIVAYNVYLSKVKSIDPATCGDVTSTVIQTNFYEGLYTYHYLKRPVEVVPQLADGMPEISDDGLTWTIRIKKGLKYARNRCFGRDETGRPGTRTVTAEDFVLAFKRIADYHLTTKLSLAFIEDKIVGIKDYRGRTRRYQPGNFRRYTEQDIVGIKAVDEHTLRIRLNRPFPQFQFVLAMHVYAPIPHEVIGYYVERENGGVEIPIAARTPEITDYRSAVGTGPYILTEWVKAGRIVLERNPDFREDFYPSEGGPGDEEAGLLADAGKRVPFVDVRYLLFVQENNPAWMMFENKKRDTANIPRDVYTQVITPDKRLLQKWETQGVRLIKDAYPAVYWLAFNMEDPVLGGSKSLRQALSLAYDVEQHIEILFNGRGIRALNTIPSGFKGHAEAGPSPYARLDLAAARKKLTQAKAELVAAGVIKPADPIPELTLHLGGVDENSRRMGAFAQRQFGKIGVRLRVELNDWPTLQKLVHNKQCQIYAMGWHADFPDAENFLQLYYSPNIKRGTNNTNYSDPAFDALYEQAETTVDEQKRIPLYAKMTRILNEDCPVLLLTEPIIYVLAYDWVYNIKLHPVGYGYGKYRRIDANMRRLKGGR